MAQVYLKFNSAVIKIIPLIKDETTFGRKPGNDIVIDHPTVSGFHGKIKKEGGQFLVEDLNSTNGTFINGRRVKSGALADKDQIGVARHILEFFATDTTAFTPPAAPLDEPAPPMDPSDPILERQLLKTLQEEQVEGAQAIEAAPKPPPIVEGLPEKLTEAAQSLIRNEQQPPEKPADAGVGVIKVISGAVDGFSEIKLKELVTYIGTSEKAAIKIKGLLAPSLAAAISRRPEGYFLKAVKAGYPKVNGNAIKEQIFLENGALIEVGGTNMVFYHSDAKKTQLKNQ